ncbi:MAG: DUF5011 domain-containing protein [Myxococcota bacterium]
MPSKLICIACAGFALNLWASSAQAFTCDANNDCSSTSIFNSSAIFCLGSYSCSESNVYSSASSVYCDGPNSCRDADRVRGSQDAYCRGHNSCYGAVSVLADFDDVVCTGRSSCAYAGSIVSTDDDVFCDGSSACREAGFIRSGALDQTYCRGRFACYNVVGGIYSQDIYCAADQSCQLAVLEADASANCTGRYSCYQSTLNTDLVYCDGPFACANAQVNVGGGAEIFCRGVNSCMAMTVNAPDINGASLRIECEGGNCDGIDVNVGDGRGATLFIDTQDETSTIDFDMTDASTLIEGSPASILATAADAGAQAVNAPADGMFEAPSAAGLDASDPALISFLGSAVASDIYESTPLVVSDDAPVTFPLGVTTVSFTATDSFGNEGMATATVEIVDTTEPQLMLNGEATLALIAGETFTDPLATAQDLVDGDLDAMITVDGIVDTTVAGTYALDYSVQDAAGNLARVSRTVIVLTAPTPPMCEAPPVCDVCEVCSECPAPVVCEEPSGNSNANNDTSNASMGGGDSNDIGASNAGSESGVGESGGCASQNLPSTAVLWLGGVLLWAMRRRRTRVLN